MGISGQHCRPIYPARYGVPLTTYAEDRTRRIAEGPTGRASYNGKFSRQQRRANARAAEKEPILSQRLLGRLAAIRPGLDGILFTQEHGMGSFRKWIVCPVGSREKPSADYTDRYKALFPVLPGTEPR